MTGGTDRRLDANISGKHQVRAVNGKGNVKEVMNWEVIVAGDSC